MGSRNEEQLAYWSSFVNTDAKKLLNAVGHSVLVNGKPSVLCSDMGSCLFSGDITCQNFLGLVCNSDRRSWVKYLFLAVVIAEQYVLRHCLYLCNRGREEVDLAFLYRRFFLFHNRCRALLNHGLVLSLDIVMRGTYFCISAVCVWKATSFLR